MESEEVEEHSAHFDAVCVCSGHFSFPALPEVEGLSSVPCRLEHSLWYRSPEPYVGKVLCLCESIRPPFFRGVSSFHDHWWTFYIISWVLRV